MRVSAVPRREEACAVCACKDWVNNRYEVYLFKEATGTTTWARHFRYGGNDEEIAGEDHGEDPRKSGDSHPAQGGLLMEDSGAFCVGPKDKIHEIPNVERYIKKWPLIPQAELHASSVQHPDDISMRWLLHSRRVERKQPVPDTSGVRNLVARFRQVLASAIKKLQCGCAKAALTICAPSIQRCPRSPLPIGCF